MKEQIIDIETAKLAYEKGFNWPVAISYIYNYTDDKYKGYTVDPKDINGTNPDPSILPKGTKLMRSYSAPTQSLLQRWLREEKGLVVEAGHWNKLYDYRITKTKHTDFDYDSCCDNEDWDNWEEALESGLLEALKLI